MGNNLSAHTDKVLSPRNSQHCALYCLEDGRMVVNELSKVLAHHIFTLSINVQLITWNALGWLFLLFHVGRPLCDHETKDRWLTVDVGTEERICESCRGSDAAIPEDHPVEYFNMQNASIRITKDGCKFPPDNSEERIVLYHATDVRAADHIIVNGIKLEKGRNEQDFSDGRGFYLSTDYRVAMDRAKSVRKRRNCSAIIVFSINKTYFEKYRGYQLDGEEWAKVIRYNRFGRDRSKLGSDWGMMKTLYNEKSSCDYLEGAMCVNPQRLSETAPASRDYTGTVKHQICILSESMAEFVGCLKHTTVLFQEN